MRICERLACLAALGAILAAAPAPAFALDGSATPGAQPALAFDGTPAPAHARTPTPVEAFRSGAQALRAGQTAKGINALEYAADQGHAAAQWKLGRIYAEGDGVKRDDLRAFD